MSAKWPEAVTVYSPHIIRERGGLTEEQAVLVWPIAKTREQKLALLDCLFAVSAADESISTAEDKESVR